ncbi:hypothetical protein [Cylindrospermum stagnale]|nr:hypothetical protein [Cylindrospermum stagnale]
MKECIYKQVVLGADETSFEQENVDGCNHQGSQAWLCFDCYSFTAA